MVFIWLVDTSRIRHAVQWHQQEQPEADYTGLQYVDEAFIGAVFLGSMRNDADTAVDIAAYNDTLAEYFSRYGKSSLRGASW